MNLDDLIQRLKEAFTQIQERILESAAYNDLRERYDTWPRSVQKGVLFGAGVIVLLLLLSIPTPALLSSFEKVGMHKEYQRYTKEILKYAGVSSQKPLLPDRIVTSKLIKEVKKVLEGNEISEAQIVSIQEDSKSRIKNIARPPLSQRQLKVDLKLLTLTQVVALGTALEKEQKGVRILGLSVSHSKEKTKENYLDATYRLVAFADPDWAKSVKGSKDSKKKKRLKRVRRSKRGQ